ncbi:astakine-like isoform X2 [Leptopilina heterotoma]|nr:astakine-like isoform X2 [Leptopilina heterotoma]
MTRQIISSILVIVMTAMVFSTAQLDRTCKSSEECPAGYCCTLQPTRYSIPTCSPMIKEGLVCKPSINIINTTLSYPNGNQLTIWNVHYIMCPCEDGLVCDRRAGGICKSVSSNEV